VVISEVLGCAGGQEFSLQWVQLGCSCAIQGMKGISVASVYPAALQFLTTGQSQLLSLYLPYGINSVALITILEHNFLY